MEYLSVFSAGNEVVVINGFSLDPRSAWKTQNIFTPSVVFRAICTMQALLQCYFCWRAQCWQSPPNLPLVLPNVYVHVCVCAPVRLCVCLRKWCSTGLCKFPSNRAETKISSAKHPRQPFGRHAPCSLRVFSCMERRMLVVPLMRFCVALIPLEGFMYSETTYCTKQNAYILNMLFYLGELIQ